MEPKQMRRAPVIAAVGVLLIVVALASWLVYAQLVLGPGQGGAFQYVHPVVEASQTCTSCKAARHDYQHLEPYTGSCERCHTTATWRDVRYTHKQADFNKSLHDVVGCPRCHTEGQPSPSPACQTCHAERSPHKVGAIACGGCHGVVAWILLRPLPAEHLSLAGGHEGLSCFDCHNVFRQADSPARGCVDCHGKQHGGLTACERCHEPGRGWKPLPGFDHAVFFPINGKHRGVGCAECHTGDRFAGTPRNCSGCHSVVHKGLTKCEQCHTTAGFVPSTFNHSAYFKITGQHTALGCSRCHAGGVYNGTPTRCVGCHGTKHGGLTACEQCHTTSGFRPSTFVHSSVFTLQGAHTKLRCDQCHTKGVFKGIPTTCSGCHGTKHGGLTACEQCHTTSGFRPSTFVHSNVFALQGAHAKLACDKCHPNDGFASNIGGGGTACSNCHDGPHGTGYTTCSTCHTTAAWIPAKAITHPGYIELGTEHRTRSCRLCHSTLLFSAATTPCQQSGCHASTITHVGPTDCLRCHRPTQWSEVHFTHPDLPIHEGTNLNQQCLWCHPGPDFTKWDCKTCHVEGGIPWSDPFTPSP